MDKIITVHRSKIGEQVEVLADADVVRLNRAIVVILRIASAV